MPDRLTILLTPLLTVWLLGLSQVCLGSQAADAPALSGMVRSQEEGAMEGVLVSARKAGANFTVTVVSDQAGRYSFPRNRVAPGRYSLSIRAVGYEMDAASVEVTAKKPASRDLLLRKTANLASQLTNTEWFQSIPADDRKSLLINCTMCHTVERIVSSTYDATAFTRVLQRMSGYYIGSSPIWPQVMPAFQRNPGDPERFRKQAEYLSTINRSNSSNWAYPLKTLPRPKGRATRVIVTEYDLPRSTAQPHEVLLASDGTVWYMDYGQQFLGKLDPKSGRVTEYAVPVLKPDQPRGGLELEEDRAGNIWVGLQLQGAITRFDRKSGQFQSFSLPQEAKIDAAQIPMVMPNYSHVDGKVWLKEAGTANQIKRLDLASGKFELAQPMPAGHSAYGIDADTSNNLYFMEVGSDAIGRVDAKTLQMSFYRTPTADSGPRRGHADSQDRLWFAENRGNKVGMFDPRTAQFQEWALPAAWSNPYDAILDKNSEVWAGGMSSDRVARVNPKTGEVTEYLLPQETNIRRLSPDNSKTPVTLWIGSVHRASVVRVDPLD